MQKLPKIGIRFNLANVLKVASFVMPLLKRKKKEESINDFTIRGLLSGKLPILKDDFEPVDPFHFVTTLETYDEKIEYIDSTVRSLNTLRETYVKMGAYELYLKTKQENERA